MASIVHSTNIKQPFKIIEVPLTKFSEEIIPHYQNVYEQYKESIKKLLALNDKEQLKKEIKEKKRNVKQLRDLMYELDTLRTQVEDDNLDHFDLKTLSLRKIILNLISGYADLEKSVNNVLISSPTSADCEKENLRPFEGTSQIHIQENLDELKLKERQDQLEKVQNIHRDVEDLHEIYTNLNGLVEIQAENVDQIASNVESAQVNVVAGAQSLAKAHKLKAVAYPVTGAVLGGIIGGPIGLVAGLKVGGIAAVACAIAGYTGGRWFRKKTVEIIPEPDQEVKEDDEDQGTISSKKDI